jgi:hypothetical protein
MATSTIMPAQPENATSETGNAHVVQEPQPAAPPSYGVNNRDLPELLRDALGALVKDFQGRDLYDRRIEVLTDRILRFYDDGVQHIYPNYGTGVYQIGVAGGYVDLGDGNSVECSEYMGAYNIFRSRRRTIDAVLTQNPPGIDFQPDHPDRSEDIEAAETAEGYRHLFDQANDVRQIQQDIARMFELSGRCVAWTHTVANRQKWGVNDDGEPRRMEVAEIFGTLESKVPIVCESVNMALFAFLYKDPDVLTAKQNNRWIRDKIVAGEAGLGESDWERYARLGVKQARKGYYLTGSALSHIVTEMHCFLRPAAFESVHCDTIFIGDPPEGGEFEETESGEPLTVRDVLKQLFPEGVHIVYVGKTYSEATPESFDDCIDIAFPVERDGLTGGALMEPMKVIQDGFNDFKNAERENYEKGWPTLYFKGDQADYDAIVDQKSGPRQYVILKESGGPDVPMGNIIYKEPDMDVPASFVQCMEEYRGPLSQDITGALPALAGEGTPDTKTASGQAMMRSQALGILGPAWANLQRMFAGIYKKAALAASKNPDHAKEISVVTGSGQSISIRLERLSRGSFHAHPDVDSTFPESTSAKRATLSQILPTIAASPIGGEFLKSPDNWEQVLKLNGFPELTLTPALAYRKQTRELEILLREAPVSNKEVVDAYNQQHAASALTAMAQGQPMPPYAPPPPLLPSIIPGKFDYHSWEFAKCQEYLSSEDCFRQQEEGNVDGVRNIELHASMHQQMLAAQAAPAGPVQLPQSKPGSAAGQAPEGNQQVQNGSQPPGAPGQPTV